MNAPASERSSQQRLLASLLLKPAMEIKSHLISMVAALLLLSLSHSLFLILVGPLFKAMFIGDASSQVSLSLLVPANLLSFWPELAHLSIDRQRLAHVLPGAILAVSMLKGLATFLFQFQQQFAALYIGRRFRETLFASIIHLPFDKLVERSPAEWMSLVVNDVSYIQVRVSDIFTGLLRDGAVVIASLLALYVIHWPTAMIVTLLSIPLAVSTGRTGKKISHFAESWQTELGSMAAAVLDLRRRFEFIRAQAGESLEKQRFGMMNKAYYRMIRRSILLRSAYAPALELFGFLMFAGVLVAIGRGYLGQSFSASDMLQFFAALGLLLRPLKSMGEQLTRYHETMGVMRRSLDTFAAVEAQSKAQGARATNSKLEPIDSCHLESILLQYKQGFSLLAKDLDLKPGRTVAIIGPSGAGKSSLLKSFAGLLAPQQWKAELEWARVAQDSTLVSQRPFLFSATIRENLLYGLEDPNVDDASLLEVLDAVGLTEELKAMDQRLDTLLDFIQTPLSGGQMQRLTIARALLRPQRLLLLDEVTSAIDPMAEETITRRIVETVKERGQSLLFVTHRLGQLALFDEVWFCEGGELLRFRDSLSWALHPRIQRFLQEAHTPA
jgi:subfamily B ATP-binding cassette protein MsbA